MSITAGDTFVFSAVFPKYPITSGWVLTFNFIRDGGGLNSTFSFSSTTPDTTGVGWAFNVLPTVTSVWGAGWYWGQGQVALTSTGETHTVWSERFQVMADITASGSVDLRSSARITLDNIKAVLTNRASQSIMESNIEGMQLRKIPVAELIVLHDKFQEIVRNEDNAMRIKAGLGSSRVIHTRFKSPCYSSPGTWAYKEWLE